MLLSLTARSAHLPAFPGTHLHCALILLSRKLLCSPLNVGGWLLCLKDTSILALDCLTAESVILFLGIQHGRFCPCPVSAPQSVQHGRFCPCPRSAPWSVQPRLLLGATEDAASGCAGLCGPTGSADLCAPDAGVFGFSGCAICGVTILTGEGEGIQRTLIYGH